MEWEAVKLSIALRKLNPRRHQYVSLPTTSYVSQTWSANNYFFGELVRILRFGSIETVGCFLRKLPALEAPFRFFKHTCYAYESWLNSISGILGTENPTEELRDRAELALSGYLFASKAAIDHLRSHYLSAGIGHDSINTRVKESKQQSIPFRFGEALRHYVTHTASPISSRSLNYSLTGRHIEILFRKADAKADAEKPGGKGWQDIELLQHLPDEIDVPESLKEHYLMTMNYVGAHFFSKDVLPSYKDFWKLLCWQNNMDRPGSVVYLIENSVSDKPATGPQNLGLVIDCSALLKNHESWLSVFLLPKTRLEIPHP